MIGPRRTDASARSANTSRCVVVARAIAVLLAVVTLAFGGGVASRGPHHAAAVARAAAQHHDVGVIALANGDPAPAAKRLAFAVALDVPHRVGPWRIRDALVLHEWAWADSAPAISHIRLPPAVVARGPPSSS
jgi:hypothetical protein